MSIQLGRLAAERQRQILMILSEHYGETQSYDDICYQMVPHGSLIQNDLSELVYYELINEAELSIDHRIYVISAKGIKFVSDLKEAADAKNKC